MGVTMQIPRDAILLRIYFGEDEKFGPRPLYEAIVLKAREMHLAGATVLRGPMGFGHSSRIHTAKILRLSEDLPIVIDIVDAEDKINAFLAAIDDMIGSGLVTLQKRESPAVRPERPAPAGRLRHSINDTSRTRGKSDNATVPIDERRPTAATWPAPAACGAPPA